MIRQNNYTMARNIFSEMYQTNKSQNHPDSIIEPSYHTYQVSLYYYILLYFYLIFNYSYDVLVCLSLSCILLKHSVLYRYLRNIVK